MSPNLIVMLTHHDKSVPHALDVFEECKDCPVEYWGFKDRGLSIDYMKRLVDTIKRARKNICFEVVRYSEKECLESAHMAVEMGVDYLMGTTYFYSVHELLKGTALKYLPFCGRVSESPSVLEGSISEIINEAQAIAAYGVYGIDLLAYRYVGDPVQLAQTFMQAIDLPVAIAGSIRSTNQLDVIKGLNPWAFTIGSAFFEHEFGHTSIREQIEAVSAYLSRR
jgi:hypothetical protein